MDQITIETTGNFMLLDHQSGKVIPHDAAITVPHTAFVTEHLKLGQLRVVGEEAAVLDTETKDADGDQEAAQPRTRRGRRGAN